MTKEELQTLREQITHLPGLTVMFGGITGHECAPETIVRYKVLAMLDEWIAKEPHMDGADTVRRSV